MSSEEMPAFSDPQLQIETGNPAGNRSASFTRFILPFSYSVNSLQPMFVEEDKGLLTYHQLSTQTQVAGELDCKALEDINARRRYQTTETATVLFDRAKWLQVQNWTDDQNVREAEVRGRNIRIRMAPPRMILFHWPSLDSKIGRRFINPLQTGFLIIELFFPADEAISLEDFMSVNEMFRYCRQPFDTHLDKNNGAFRNFIKNLWPETDNSDQKYYESRWLQWIDNVNIKIGKDRYRLELKDKDNWMVYADDRTFVWTCAILPGGANALKPLSSEPKLSASKFGHWIKLLNVDPPQMTSRATHKFSDFENTWADQRTYKRWEESGTFYGFSYHSGAMIGPDWKEPPLWKHFGRMYFDQILLLFYLRVTLFRFSNELCRLSSLEGRKKEVDDWMSEFQRLRQKFSIFTNLYQFPLISNQQQGLEMYEIAREALDVQPLFNEVQSEIHNSYEYLSQTLNLRQATTTTRLTIVATMGLMFSFVLAFFGIDGIGNLIGLTGKQYESYWAIKYTLILSILAAILLQILVILCSKKLNKWIDFIATLLNKRNKE